ncbi:MAG: oligosaccharide flippase family protein [Paludibacteraceae bacterium]|nr:oligosaccharide flippase family protein [Paludibacteraceae bacterium]
MAEKIEHIGSREILWSYAGTAFTIGAGVILLPFILNKMSQETVGIWNIFQTITMLVVLLDFGFRPTFARNISYIFSGVKALQRDGVQHAESDAAVDYGLLKGTLIAMQRFYKWMAVAVFGILATLGTAYFYYILQKYSGDRQDAMIAWVLLIAINCYNLYTYYYDALLLGKGYVKRTQQITILGQGIYIGLAIGLIYAGMGLTAIVASQLVSTVIRRVMSYRVFFTDDITSRLAAAVAKEPKEILAAISPNAIKIGLTGLGGFLVNKSAILIGSAFLTLGDVAVYGITVQVMDILARCATVFYQAYTPKLAQCRAENDLASLKRYYLLCIGSLWAVYIVGGLMWIGLGDWALGVINSQTGFVPTTMLIVMLVISALEHNHSTSAGFIMADNKIPFFIPSLASGAATVLMLWIFLSPLQMGIWGLILAPGLAQLAYQNWKWPSVVIKELWCK